MKGVKKSGIKQLRKKVLPIAKKFDLDIKDAVEQSLNVKFDELDSTKFTVDEGLGILFYNNTPVAQVCGTDVFPIINGNIIAEG